jgi:PAS domain S-box-containing protein
MLSERPFTSTHIPANLHLDLTVHSNRLHLLESGTPKECGSLPDSSSPAEDNSTPYAPLVGGGELFQQLADAMPQIVFAARPDGHVDYFNRQWYEYTGLPQGQIGFESWRHVHTAEGLERVSAVWDESLRTGKPYEIEYLLRRHDGAYRWHLGRALPVRDSGGRIVRWFGTNTDIHDQKLAEETITRARRQMQMVVRGANVGVWYCDLPFDELIWDDKVKEHFHLAPDARVTIETFYERLHPNDRDRTRTAIEASIANRTNYDIDYRTISSDGGDVKWIRAIGRTFYDDAGKPIRFDGVTIDVTERTRAELALRESEARFRHMSDNAPVMIWVTEPTARART